MTLKFWGKKEGGRLISQCVLLSLLPFFNIIFTEKNIYTELKTRGM